MFVTLPLKRQIGVSYNLAWWIKQKIMQVMKNKITSGHPIYMNFNVEKGFWLSEVEHWSKQYLAKGSPVVSDGLACFKAVKRADCEYFSIVTGGGPKSVNKAQFIWVNTMIGNVKNSITGTYLDLWVIRYIF
ncbi:MAG: hypothetical protein ACI86X_001720 [Moritella sp.]